MLTVYTDGSSLTPNGIGAWAYVIVEGVTDEEVAATRKVGKELAADSEAANSITNNRMEMTAIYRGLHAAKHYDLTRGLRVVSDSQYAIKGITDWRDGWEARGMKTANGQPVKNKDMWDVLWKVVDSFVFPIIFEHVKGHRGVFWNEYVDKMAGGCAARFAEERRHAHGIDR